MKKDKNEFIKLVKANQAIINKICFGYTNNIDDRLDLNQEILIQLWKAYPKFDHHAKLSTWIYRIALNTAISNFRKAKRKVKVDELIHHVDHLNATNSNPDSEAQISELYGMIHRLNDLEKAIMLLYLDEQSYKEIAEIVGISETNVATKISRIKLKLKNDFNKNQEGGND